MIEVKMGSYKPQISNEAGLTGNPYDEVFDGGMLLFELEFERQFFQSFGSAAIAFSVGYAEKYGNTVVSNTGVATAEKTALFVVPLRLLAVYRFDYAARELGIPLVPFVKGGLVYTPWWSTKGGRVSNLANGAKAKGGKWGYQGTVGLAFLMDVLEPRLARDFDTSVGVNHTYLFAEYTYAKVDDFGKRGLDLSSKHFTFGLAFEF
jgi:hypothetical protein